MGADGNGGAAVAPVTRYFIGHDDCGHAYAVPVEHREAWYAFVNSLMYPNPLDEPDYAVRIDGRFTFTDPRCE